MTDPIATSRRIARLAHLELTSDEIARLGTELSSILSHVQVLSSVDTSGVAETSTDSD